MHLTRARGTWYPHGPRCPIERGRGQRKCAYPRRLPMRLPLLVPLSNACEGGGASMAVPSKCTHDDTGRQRQPFAAPPAPSHSVEHTCQWPSRQSGHWKMTSSCSTKCLKVKLLTNTQHRHPLPRNKVATTSSAMSYSRSMKTVAAASRLLYR